MPEVLVATTIMAVGVVAVAQLLVLEIGIVGEPRLQRVEDQLTRLSCIGHDASPIAE